MVISGNVAYRRTRIQRELDFLALYVCQRGTSPKNTATFFGRGNARNGPLPYERFLEFGKCCQYVEY